MARSEVRAVASADDAAALRARIARLEARVRELEPLERAFEGARRELRAHAVRDDLRHRELEAAREALDLAERRYRDLFDLAPVGHLVVDEEGRVLDANTAAAQLLARPAEDLRGRRLADLVAEADHERLEHQLAHQPGDASPEPPEGFTIELRRGDATAVACLLRAAALPAGDGTPARRHVTLVDVSAHRETEEQLRKARDYLDHLAHHDPLTDLPNRLLFADRLRHAVNRARRHGHNLGLLFIDVDRFKLVNDSFGHSAGDALLKVMARRIVDCVRDEDTVARIGGDEFTVILENVPGDPDVERIARKIVARISEPLPLAGHEVCLSASIGVSMYPRDTTEADDLLKYADVAMYHAKERGRRDVQFFTRELNATLLGRLALEHELRRAIDGDELELHYQPQRRAVDRRLAGLEALVRWRHPSRGLLLPAEFIGAAEDSGLIDGLGHSVLEAACRQIREWLTAGLRVRRVAVNFSARQFARPGFVALVTETLERARVPASLLEIELTESALLADPEAAIDVLGELRATGMHLAIDDFGTGFSSLSRLRRLPISRLKIDSSFVQGITLNSDDRAIASAIISMAHDLNLEAVSEGVETAEQRAFLERYGCDVLQGHFIGYPGDASSIEPLLRAA